LYHLVSLSITMALGWVWKGDPSPDIFGRKLGIKSLVLAILRRTMVIDHDRSLDFGVYIHIYIYVYVYIYYNIFYFQTNPINSVNILLMTGSAVS
jgi:hypothetical protein